MKHVCSALLALALLAATAAAADDDPGHALYLRYCGACHGPAGAGDGIAAMYLQPRPPDLTGYAKANGGRFPFQRVAQAIDGTTPVGPHGNREMPIWGEVFKSEDMTSPATEARVRGKVYQITEYLRTIQVK